MLFCAVGGGIGLAQEDLPLNPTRPTVANSANIQGKGVLQVEVGYDAYPQHVPGNQQAVDMAFYYTPWKRARLDFTWTPVSHLQNDSGNVTGVGTVQLGTKVLLVRDRTHRWLPGIGVQYEAELPTATDEALQGYGQQAILLVNHHFGPVDVIANGSVVQDECQTEKGCSVGGQQSAALSYHASQHTSLYAEVFAQNVSQSNTPPGTYVFAGFLHRIGGAMAIDGGMRFGVSDHAASIGTTVGLVFGRRLQGEAEPRVLIH